MYASFCALISCYFKRTPFSPPSWGSPPYYLRFSGLQRKQMTRFFFPSPATNSPFLTEKICYLPCGNSSQISTLGHRFWLHISQGTISPGTTILHHHRLQCRRHLLVLEAASTQGIMRGMGICMRKTAWLTRRRATTSQHHSDKAGTRCMGAKSFCRVSRRLQRLEKGMKTCGRTFAYSVAPWIARHETTRSTSINKAAPDIPSVKTELVILFWGHRRTLDDDNKRSLRK